MLAPLLCARSLGCLLFRCNYYYHYYCDYYCHYHYCYYYYYYCYYYYYYYYLVASRSSSLDGQASRRGDGRPGRVRPDAASAHTRADT